MEGKFKFPGELPVPPREGEPEGPHSPLLVHLVLSRATELAHEGRYEDAVQALADLRMTPAQAPPVYHLLARIFAQLGRLDDAEKYWKRVLVQDREHEGARRGLQAIQRIRSRGGFVPPLLLWPVALAVLLGILLIVALSRGSTSREASDPSLKTTLEGVLAAQRQMGEELGHLRAENESLRRRLEERTTSLPPAGGPPDLDFTGLVGVAWKTEKDTLVVRFTTPLFRPGLAILGPEEEKAARELGKRLVPQAGTLSVRVLCHPVPEGVDAGAALAGSRGNRLWESMLALPELRSIPFSIDTAEATAVWPFPKDPPETQAVVLRLARVKK